MAEPTYYHPGDNAERRQEKLEKIVEVLMRRVERDTDQSSPSYSHFQAAIVLEKQVKSRTKDLEEALELLEQANSEISTAKAEAEAARSDLANALEAIQEGFALFDPDDRLIMRNSRFCAYLPDVKDRLEAGLSFSDYVTLVSRSDFIVLDAPDHRDAWIKARLRAHSRKHSNFNVEHKDNRWIQVSEQRTPDNSTAILQTDVTDMLRIERKERNKILGTQADMIRATLDHLDQGIAIFDASHSLIGSNVRLREMLSPPQRLLQTGTSFAAVVDYFLAKKSFVEAPELERLMAWVYGSDPRKPLAISLTSSDERHYDVFCQETPQQGFVISFSDVTTERNAISAMHTTNETLEQRVEERTSELIDARDQAERANASKSRFVAAVSHDLLQPLNAAKLFIGSLKELDQPDQAKELTRRIGSAFESVETILGALLDITKLDSGAQTVEMTTFPIDSLLNSVREQFRHTAAVKGLKLNVRPSRAIVRSDYTYLLRIIQNLVTNAIRYTSKGGVLVAARPRGKHLQIEVWDTGAGISDNHRAEIFKEFKRLDEDGKSEPGMGLGLAIVERACGLLNHPLTFSSELSKGSVFRVRIPLVSSKFEQMDRPKTSNTLVKGSQTPLVSLVIESGNDTDAPLTETLEDWGINTIDASDSEQAIQLLQEVGITPDVIIVNRPDALKGTDLVPIDEIRSTFGPIPAVLITSARPKALIARAKENNILLLQKPIEPRHLRSILAWLQTPTRETA